MKSAAINRHLQHKLEVKRFNERIDLLAQERDKAQAELAKARKNLETMTNEWTTTCGELAECRKGIPAGWLPVDACNDAMKEAEAIERRRCVEVIEKQKQKAAPSEYFHYDACILAIVEAAIEAER